MDVLVKFLFRLVADWIAAHPEAAFSRFMTKPQGSPTDVRRMTRVQRLASAVTFLLWGCAFLGLQAVTALLTSRLGLLSAENPLVQAVMFATTFLAGGGLLGGIYLLVRVLF